MKISILATWLSLGSHIDLAIANRYVYPNIEHLKFLKYFTPFTLFKHAIFFNAFFRTKWYFPYLFLLVLRSCHIILNTLQCTDDISNCCSKSKKTRCELLHPLLVACSLFIATLQHWVHFSSSKLNAISLNNWHWHCVVSTVIYHYFNIPFAIMFA